MNPVRPLKLIAIWSLIPSYSLAGALIGYGLDRWLHTFPFMLCAGIIIAFALAIRDMLKLRDEVFEGKKRGDDRDARNP